MRSKILAAGSALLLAAGLISFGAAPAVAGASGGQVCSSLDSGKFDVSGQQKAVTITAPNGQLISGYCVKAGSVQNGNGPEYIAVSSPEKTITFGHSSNKDVSHWSASYVSISRDAGASVSTTPATCTTGQSLVLGAATNATWGTPSRTTGPGPYNVTATAIPNHLFPDGKSSATFGGTLSGPLTGTQCDEVVSVVLPPSASDSCGTANDGLTLPTSNQVSYTVNDERIDGVGNVTVTAKTNTGLIFADNLQTVWVFHFTDADCDGAIVPAAPRVTGELCFFGDVIAGSINVELDDGIDYRIAGNGVDMVATKAINNVDPGTYTVTAVAKPGRVLDGQTVWTVRVAAAQACGELETHPLVTPSASMTNFGCDKGASYTLDAIEGVLWFVGGEPAAAGTYPVTAAGTVHVTAQADGPEYGLEFEAQTHWTFKFAAAEACGDLQTLALTGTQAVSGLLIPGALLLLLGGGVVVALNQLKKARAA